MNLRFHSHSATDRDIYYIREKGIRILYEGGQPNKNVRQAPKARPGYDSKRCQGAIEVCLSYGFTGAVRIVTPQLRGTLI